MTPVMIQKNDPGDPEATLRLEPTTRARQAWKSRLHRCSEVLTVHRSLQYLLHSIVNLVMFLNGDAQLVTCGCIMLHMMVLYMKSVAIYTREADGM